MNKTNFPIQVPIQMRWKDIDSLGHLNNTHLATYLEEARIRMLSEHLDWDWKKVGVILARLEINYRKPMFYPNDVLVHAACTRIGNTSFDIEHLVTGAEGKEIYADAKVVIVAFDLRDNEPMMIPDDLREKLGQYGLNIDPEKM